MALPSSRRPVEIEEDILDYSNSDLEEDLAPPSPPLKKLKFKISKVEVFHDTMTKWYKGLKSKEKATLTPIKLKRRAIGVCYELKLKYENLPEDWVPKLKKECGLKLCDTKALKGRIKSILAELSSENREKFAPKPLTRPREASIKAYAKCSSSVTSALNNQHVVDSGNEETKKKHVKRFIDCTRLPPPPVWLASFIKGIVLPRMKVLYSTEDTNILYYDYAPKLKDSVGSELKLTPHPRFDVKALIDPNPPEENTRHDGRALIKTSSSRHRIK